MVEAGHRGNGSATNGNGKAPDDKSRIRLIESLLGLDESVSREMERSPGVYALVNRKNKKLYIGSATGKVKDRFRGHDNELSKGIHCNRYLQHAWNRDGDQFVLVVIENCSPERCIEREQFWMDYFRSWDRNLGYNLSPTAGNNSGLKYSKESRARIAANTKKAWDDPEKRRLMVKANQERITQEFRDNAAKLQEERWKNQEYADHVSSELKRVWSDPDRRREQAERRKGTKHSKETKAKMSASQLKRPPKSEHTRQLLSLANLGKKHSPETRKKLSEVQRGRKQTPEHVANVKAALARPEVKEKMRQSHLGKEPSPETRARMSASLKRVWKRRRAGR